MFRRTDYGSNPRSPGYWLVGGGPRDSRSALDYRNRIYTRETPLVILWRAEPRQRASEGSEHNRPSVEILSIGLIRSKDNILRARMQPEENCIFELFTGLTHNPASVRLASGRLYFGLISSNRALHIASSHPNNRKYPQRKWIPQTCQHGIAQGEAKSRKIVKALEDKF